MKDRQKAWLERQQKVEGSEHNFSDDEIDYLLERLAGVNDPLGQSVFKKIESLKERDE